MEEASLLLLDAAGAQSYLAQVTLERTHDSRTALQHICAGRS
jgi:hypothetical protein